MSRPDAAGLKSPQSVAESKILILIVYHGGEKANHQNKKLFLACYNNRMSRSKRKPYVTDRYGKRIRKFYKRKHNKLIRKKCADPGFEIPDGAGHRRGLGVNPWDICDYKIYIHPEDDYYVKAVNK